MAIFQKYIFRFFLHKKLFLVFINISIICLCFCADSFAQLVINEVSQGPSASKEYIELLVTGTQTCASQCVDLRGWIIDDNNGWHAAGVGVGIASGCVRFRNVAFWSCIKKGSIIVIYDYADRNALIPPDDSTDSNNDCVYVLRVNSTNLFERYIISPSSTAGDSLYLPNTWTWTAGGTWSPLSMANSDDSYHTVAPGDSLNTYHSVSWGNNTKRNIIYFSGTAAGYVMSMTNSSNNDIFNQANWVKAAVAGNETPGAPNNAANASWINSMNNSCLPLCCVGLTVTTAQTNVSCNSGTNGSASATGSGGTAPYTYKWTTGSTAQSISSLSAGTYTATVRDVTGCIGTSSVVITQPNPIVITLAKTYPSCVCPCPGKAFTNNVTGGTMPYTYLWNTGGTGQVISNLCPGIYTVNITDNKGCTGSGSITLP